MKRSPVSSKKVRSSQEQMFCNYVHRVCMQNRLEGYAYCIRHILEDKTAPFRQCCFTHPHNAKRCTNAAPKTDKKESLCPWHARKALQNRKLAAKRHRGTESPATLLASLEHHCQRPHDELDQNAKIGTTNRDRNPDNFTSLSYIDNLLDRRIGGDAKKEIPAVDETWRGDADSEAESVDSEHDDPLKHAGVYTAEEAALIMRDKLIRLQSLYIDQFKWLQHVLREKRRNYLHAVKRERDVLGSISANTRTTPEEICSYERLKALQRYHRRHGKEALLHQQAQERRRAAAEGALYKPPSYPECSFDLKGEKCAKRAIPLNRFCFRHILTDPQQVLFTRCQGEKDECIFPVVSFTDHETCIVHTNLVGSAQNWQGSSAQHTAVNRLSDVDALTQEPEHFQSMDDIAALGLDVVQPGSLFGLNQFGDPGESTDSTLSGDGPGDLMQPLTLNSTDILCTAHKGLDQDVK